MTIDLNDYGGRVYAERGAYLFVDADVKVFNYTPQIMSAFFGGKGLFMQRLEGPSKVFIGANGVITQNTLKAGEKSRPAPSLRSRTVSTIAKNVSNVSKSQNRLLWRQRTLHLDLDGPRHRLVGVASVVRHGGAGSRRSKAQLERTSLQFPSKVCRSRATVVSLTDLCSFFVEKCRGVESQAEPLRSGLSAVRADGKMCLQGMQSMEE